MFIKACNIDLGPKMNTSEAGMDTASNSFYWKGQRINVHIKKGMLHVKSKATLTFICGRKTVKRDGEILSITLK